MGHGRQFALVHRDKGGVKFAIEILVEFFAFFCVEPSSSSNSSKYVISAGLQWGANVTEFLDIT